MRSPSSDRYIYILIFTYFHLLSLTHVTPVYRQTIDTDRQIPVEEIEAKSKSSQTIETTDTLDSSELQRSDRT